MTYFREYAESDEQIWGEVPPRDGIDEWARTQDPFYRPYDPPTDSERAARYTGPGFGRAFGRIMKKHPDADARLVNDILAEAITLVLNVPRGY